MADYCVVAGTGHRPNKLGGYGSGATSVVVAVAAEWLSDNRPEYVITGGALGWDQALAQAAKNLGLPYAMFLPFKDFDNKWPADSRKNLERLCEHAEDVRYICEDGYAPWKMQKRNEAMVDRSTHVLALWNGTTGGTANCVRYAEKVGNPIINLWSRWESLNG